MALHAEDFLSPQQIDALLVKRGIKAPEKPKKKHKYGAKRVVVDGLSFPSLLEAKLHTRLKIEYQGGLITEPLHQVRFSLGEHYGEEKFYVADKVFIELKRGNLVVADAKGHRTKDYEQKREQFYRVYGFCIREYEKRDV